MSETTRRHVWSPPIPAAMVFPPALAERAADQAREQGLPYIASLYDAAAAAWQAALCTLGEERDRLNRAGEAAWCAGAARMMGLGG